MIAFVRRAEARILVSMGHPVKLSAVNDGAAYRRPMSVHVLRGRMSHNIRSPLKGTAVYGSGKGVVYDQRHPMGMGAPCEFFDIQHRQRGIGDGFSEHNLCIVPKSCVQLFLGGIGTHKCHIDTHPFHGDGNQIIGSPIDGAGGYDMVAAAADIEQCIEIGCLTAAGQHACSAALQLCNFRRHIVIGRILKSGVEIPACLQIEKPAHILTGIILESGALNNGNLAGLTVSRRISALYTNTVYLHLALPSVRLAGICLFSSIHISKYKFNHFLTLPALLCLMPKHPPLGISW